MSIRDELRNLESAEQLFALLEVSFDSRVLATHRLRVLRRFGREIATLEQAPAIASDQDWKQHCAAILQRIHEECARGMREPEPVFRGLQEPLIQLRRSPKR